MLILCQGEVVEQGFAAAIYAQFAPDPQQFFVEPVAGNLVESAEGPICRRWEWWTP